jgi:predicted acetyltransferase
MLLGSIAGIYQRYGYAVVSTRVQYSIDPRWINLVPSMPQPRGRWREATRDELPLIKSMYREYVGPRNGHLHRASIMWDAQVLGVGPAFGGPNFGPSLLNIYEEDGEPQGYIAYAAHEFDTFTDNAGPGQRVAVRELVALKPSAYAAGWQLLKTFDLARRVIMYAPTDDPAFDILLDPRELHAERGDWLLARIIDLERELPLRPYGAGRVVFAVRDEMCSWNDGRWALEAGPEGATVTRTTETPELTMDISALAQLLFGQVSPTNAVRYGRAEAAPHAPLKLWDDMWRTAYAPFCPDGF